MRLGILRWGDCSGLSKWPQCTPQGSSEGEGNVKMEADIEMTCFEGGGGGHRAKNTGSHWKLKKAGKWILPLKPLERISPDDILPLPQ